MDKLINLVTECGLCDEASIRKMDKKVNTFQFMWSLVGILPSDQFGKEMFTNCLHFLCGAFLIDDAVENYGAVQMEKLSKAYDLLEQQSSEAFPNFPSISEMKKCLEGSMSSAFDIGSVIFCMQYVNKMALIFLKEGSTPENVVLDARRKTSNAISISLQAVLIKAKHGSKVAPNEMLWRRIFDGLVILFYEFGELVSGVTKYVQEHVAVVTELRILGCLYCIVINDLYSYHRDKLSLSDSIIKTWLAQNTVSDLSEATTKCCQILDVVMKYILERVEECKLRFPDCPEFLALLESTVYTTVGWVFSHKIIVPRYTESALQVAIVELEKEEIPVWLAEKDEYGFNVVKHIVEAMNNKGNKGIMDALSGFVEGRGQLIKALV